MEVRFYMTAAGQGPVQDYIVRLPADDRARIDDALAALSEAERIEDAQVVNRHIEGRLWELKISRHRVFYALIAGPMVLLLHAYKKQGQKAPVRELDVARRRLREVSDG